MTTETKVEEALSFPDKWKDRFEGLLYLGYLSKKVKIPFHEFEVRTLTIDEKLQISLMTKPWVDTIGYSRAFQTAVVAAGLVSVDGRELIASSKDVGQLQQKYDYVSQSWYDPVITLLFKVIDALEGEVLELLKEIGILEKDGITPIFKDEVEKTTNDPKGGE